MSVLQKTRAEGDGIRRPSGHLITGTGREEVMRKGGGEEARSVRCMCDVCAAMATGLPSVLMLMRRAPATEMPQENGDQICWYQVTCDNRQKIPTPWTSKKSRACRNRAELSGKRHPQHERFRSTQFYFLYFDDSWTKCSVSPRTSTYWTPLCTFEYIGNVRFL